MSSSLKLAGFVTAVYVLWASGQSTAIGQGGYVIWAPLVGFVVWVAARFFGKK